MKFSDNEIANGIRMARINAHMNQEQVSEKTGLSVRSICLYETGKVCPGFDKAVKLADVFGCTLDQLAGR